MSKLEKVNGYYFLAGNYVEDIENELWQIPQSRLCLVNCDIIYYDEDGVCFDAGDTSEVYFLSVGDEREYLLAREE